MKYKQFKKLLAWHYGQFIPSVFGLTPFTVESAAKKLIESLSTEKTPVDELPDDMAEILVGFRHLNTVNRLRAAIRFLNELIESQVEHLDKEEEDKIVVQLDVTMTGSTRTYMSRKEFERLRADVCNGYVDLGIDDYGIDLDDVFNALDIEVDDVASVKLPAKKSAG